MGLASLGAYLRGKGVSFRIIDSNFEKLTVEETLARIKGCDFNCLGFSLNIYNLGPAVRIIKKLREAGYRQHITAGGAFASLYAELLFANFPFFDSIVCGDGEAAAYELALNLRAGGDWRRTSGIIYPAHSGRLVRNPPVRVTGNLDVLPHPMRYGAAGWIQPVELGRGCYSNCSFCALQEFYGLSGNMSVRRRSLKAFFDEVEELYRAGGRRFNFQADNFFPSADAGEADRYLEEFSREIEKRGLDLGFFMACRVNDISGSRLKILKKCGLSGLFIGVESVNDAELKVFNKKISVKEICDAVNLLNSEKVSFDCGYIFFSPWTTVSDLARSANFMVKVGLEHFPYGAYRMKAHIHTKVAKDIETAGLTRKNGGFPGAGIETLYHQYDFNDPLVGFIWEQVDALYRRIYAYILETAIETYKACNALTKPKIISDLSVLRFVADLIKSGQVSPEVLKTFAKERSELHFNHAKESVAADVKRFLSSA